MTESAPALTVRWLKTLWLGATCRCPKCGQGKMFETFYRIHKTCPQCGVRLQPYAGDSLGVYAVCYFFSLVPAMIALVLAFAYTDIPPMGLVALFGVVSGVILFGLYPNMKGVWVALVYLSTGLRPQL